MALKQWYLRLQMRRDDFGVSTLNFMGEWEKQLLDTLGEVASKGNELPKTFPPKQLFLRFEQGT